jgi:hypothetical protein
MNQIKNSIEPHSTIILNIFNNISELFKFLARAYRRPVKII